MIRNRLFHKYFFLAVFNLILFIVLGFVFNAFLFRQLMPQPFPSLQHNPPTFYARVIDRLTGSISNRAHAIEELLSWQGSIKPKLLLLDQNGKVLYPPLEKNPVDWDKTEKPIDDYAYKYVPSEGHQHFHHMHPPPGMELLHFLGGPPQPPPGGFGHGGPPGMSEDQPVLIKLPGDPVQFLYMEPPEMPLPPEFEKSVIPLPWIGLISQLVSLLLGIAVTLSIIYWSMREKVRQADEVISELQSGNLKARFKITRDDEFGQAMIRFNKMAEEIEKLVEHMRQVESARNKLIQELAHDLRTPIASLKSLLETLNLRRQGLSQGVQTELLMLSSREVDYFERLVEDLLFLSQVNEPKYRSRMEKVDLPVLLQDEIDSLLAKNSQGQKTIQLEGISETQQLLFEGDFHLLRRMFRNAFENSYSFAKNKVSVRVSQSEHEITVIIDDDGPGFTPESLQNFGEKKFSRHLEKTPEGRVSVGLGSVIIKTICEIYRGKVEVSNQHGARVKITLPI